MPRPPLWSTMRSASVTSRGFILPGRKPGHRPSASMLMSSGSPFAEASMAKYTGPGDPLFVAPRRISSQMDLRSPVALQAGASTSPFQATLGRFGNRSFCVPRDLTDSALYGPPVTQVNLAPSTTPLTGYGSGESHSNQLQPWLNNHLASCSLLPARFERWQTSA